MPANEPVGPDARESRPSFGLPPPGTASADPTSGPRLEQIEPTPAGLRATVDVRQVHEIIRAASGYAINPPLTELSWAITSGFVESISKSEFDKRSASRADAQSSATAARKAHEEAVNAAAELGRRLESVRYNYWPLTLFTKASRETTVAEKSKADRTVESRSTACGLASETLAGIAKTVTGFVPVGKGYLRVTPGGAAQLPETRIIADFGALSPAVAKLCPLDWKEERAAIAPAAALLTPVAGEAQMPMSLAEFKLVRDRLVEICPTSWAIERGALTATAALLPLSEIERFSRRYREITEICPTGWAAESAFTAPAAALSLDRDLNEYAAVYRELRGICRTGWAAESAVIAVAAALVTPERIPEFTRTYRALSEICRMSWKEESADVAIAAAVISERQIPYFAKIYAELSNNGSCAMDWADESATVCIAAAILTRRLFESGSV